MFLLALVLYCAGQIASRIGGHFGGEASCVHTQPRTREGAVTRTRLLQYVADNKRSVQQKLTSLFSRSFSQTGTFSGAQNFCAPTDRTNVCTGKACRLLPRLCLARAPTQPPCTRVHGGAARRDRYTGLWRLGRPLVAVRHARDQGGRQALELLAGGNVHEVHGRCKAAREPFRHLCGGNG